MKSERCQRTRGLRLESGRKMGDEASEGWAHQPPSFIATCSWEIQEQVYTRGLQALLQQWTPQPFCQEMTSVEILAGHSHSAKWECPSLPKQWRTNIIFLTTEQVKEHKTEPTFPWSIDFWFFNNGFQSTGCQSLHFNPVQLCCRALSESPVLEKASETHYSFM